MAGRSVKHMCSAPLPAQTGRDDETRPGHVFSPVVIESRRHPNARCREGGSTMRLVVLAALIVGSMGGLLGSLALGELSGRAGAVPPAQSVREQNLDGGGF